MYLHINGYERINYHYINMNCQVIELNLLDIMYILIYLDHLYITIIKYFILISYYQ